MPEMKAGGGARDYNNDVIILFSQLRKLAPNKTEEVHDSEELTSPAERW